jgi:hypothetical protein
LDHSYLIVDYDRNNFSVSQALCPDTNVPQELVTILPPSEHGSSYSMSTATIAGTAIGAVIGVIILLGIAFLTRRKWLPKTLKESNEYQQPGFAKPELDSTAVDGSKMHLDPTSHSDGNFYGSDIHRESSGHYEVMGDVRPLAELPGPSSAANLPSELSGSRVYRTEYELP